MLNENNSQATILQVLGFPNPWPPSSEVWIYGTKLDVREIVLGALPGGKIFVEISDNQYTKHYHFQPIDVTPEVPVIVSILINGDAVEVHLNQHVLKFNSADVLHLPPPDNFKWRAAPALALSPHTKHSYAEYFFLKTLEDIETKVKSSERYDIVRLAAILRQLLLEQSLIEVNRSHKLKLLFPRSKRGEGEWPFATRPEYMSSSILLPFGETEFVNLQTLLATTCVELNGVQVSAKDAISAVANCLGGVHHGSVRTAQIDAFLRSDNYSMHLMHTLQPIQQIATSVLHGVAPLVKKIQASVRDDL